jgi:uncharacterized DUF497 family protein
MDTCYELNGELFVWDAAKAALNLRKHGVSFEEASSVFFDPLFVLVEASRNEEARQAAIGFDATGRLLFVVHVDIEETRIRLISARRGTPEEEKHYAS